MISQRCQHLKGFGQMRCIGDIAFFDHANNNNIEHSNGEYLYNKFTTVVKLDQVVRQSKLEILKEDSLELFEYKQNQNDYIDMLDGIHDCKYEKKYFDLISKRFDENISDEERIEFLKDNCIHLVRENATKDAINRKRVEALDGNKILLKAK